MDGLPTVGSANSAAGNSFPAPAQGPPVAVAADPTGSKKDSPSYSPEIADAPSPTPESIVADTKKLPASIRYAPSSAPPESGHVKFDRSA